MSNRKNQLIIVVSVFLFLFVVLIARNILIQNRDPEVYVIGAYDAVSDEVVTINIDYDFPIILALTGYNSINWQIHTNSVTNIKAIYTGGLSEQKVDIILRCNNGSLRSRVLCFFKDSRMNFLDSTTLVRNNEVKKEVQDFDCVSAIVNSPRFTPGLSEDVIEKLEPDCEEDMKNFYAINTGKEPVEKIEFFTQLTASGEILIDDEVSIQEVNQSNQLYAEGQQKMHSALYEHLIKTINELTNLPVTEFRGATTIVSASLNQDGLEITEKPKSTKEEIVQNLKERNKEFLERQQELNTPIIDTSTKESRFSWDISSELRMIDENYKMTFGKNGYVFDLEDFIAVGGLDLNDDQIGTVAQVSKDGLPANVSLESDTVLSEDGNSVLLRKTISNNGHSPISAVQYFFFIDPEMVYGELENLLDSNDRTDEYGEYVEFNSDNNVNEHISWEIDEPGFVFGDIFDNLRLGKLDNSTQVTKEFYDDPSFALGFRLNNLLPNEEKTVEILLSTESNHIGSFALVHKDLRLTEELMISGAIVQE